MNKMRRKQQQTQHRGEWMITVGEKEGAAVWMLNGKKKGLEEYEEPAGMR